MIPPDVHDWAAIAPLAITACAALVVLLCDLMLPVAARRGASLAVALIGIVAAGCAATRGYGPSYAAFGDAFATGGFTVVFEETILVAALLSVLLARALGRAEQSAGAIALLLWSTTGALLMAGATNYLTIFLGLELLSLALYCLCGLSAKPRAHEAALKYLLLSSAASGFLLYGLALLFGATGSVALSALAEPNQSAPLLAVGMGLFLMGLAFKLGLVPFHVWTPDVFEGAPLPVTAFMSVVTKAGALAVLARVAYAAAPREHAVAIFAPLWVLAALSIAVGNAGALAQTDLKRLLAYSGIAQLGYVVAALAGRTALGLRYAIFYLVAYTFMNLGAFAVATLVSREGEEGARLESYRSLGAHRPALAAAMTFFLVGLAGLPPTGGFTGKFLILASATDAGYAWLAGFVVVGTAVSAFAYLKIVRTMYVRGIAGPVRPATPRRDLLPWIGVAVCVVAVFAMGVYPLAPSDVLPTVR